MNGKIGDFEEWDSGNNQINEPRTLWLREAAGNKTKRKMEYRKTIPRVMMMTFHLWNERLIFTWEEVLASDGVFAPTAELCIVNFFYLLFLWNYRIAVTFCVLCTRWNWYSFLWYWPACAFIFVHDRSLMRGSRYRGWRTLFVQDFENL